MRSTLRSPAGCGIKIQDRDCPVGARLLQRGIGIEAGVLSVPDVETLLAGSWSRFVRRVLVETVHELDDEAAVSLVRAIDTLVAPLGRPRLWHGHDRATWAVVHAALGHGADVRVGLEDTLVGRDGTPAPDNADQVAATLARVAR